MKIILSKKEAESITGVVMDVQEEIIRDGSQEGELKIMKIKNDIKRYISDKTNVEEKYISICWYKDSIIIEINDELVSDSVNLFGKFTVKIVKAFKPLMNLFINGQLQYELDKFVKKWYK